MRRRRGTAAGIADGVADGVAERNVVAAAMVVAIVVSSGGCAPPDPGRPHDDVGSLLRVAEAADARPAGGPALETLHAALASESAAVRAAAARALGRLERPDAVPVLTPLLDDPDPGVRAEAANALAQSVHRGPGGAALTPLLSRLEAETEPAVIAALARSLGRIRVDGGDRDQVVRALLASSRTPAADDAPPETLVGVALGFASLARRDATRDPGPESTARLRHLLVTAHGSAGNPAFPRIRALALTALTTAGAALPDDVARGLADPDAGVRLAAVRAAGTLPAALRAGVGAQVTGDPSAQVRQAAVELLSGLPRGAAECDILAAAATGDADAGVRLQALDALARPCPDRDAQISVLEAVAAGVPRSGRLDWHAPAHAAASLAALDAARAQAWVAALLHHPVAFARARAAAPTRLLGDTSALRTLLRDPDATVRTAAAPALAGLDPEGARPHLVGALARETDPGAVLTLAGLLSAGLGSAARDAARTGEPGAAARAASTALERMDARGAMTDRDARMALLDLIDAAGTDAEVASLEPYLRDHDPAVAARAAAALSGRTGQRWLASPRPSPVLPVPSAAEYRDLENAVVVLHPARGGRIIIELLPGQAPTNALRFASLAASGALDGLTFHRVVPNFVVQGLSPGANEYAGHGAYTRDEVGLPVQWRGTVGVSTRGRDTGDGQIYVNLVDNVRLDHDYTILGRVVEGMDVADGVLEGDPMTRVELVRRTDVLGPGNGAEVGRPAG